MPKKSTKAAKKGGKSAASKARNEARRAMLPGLTAEGPAAVDLDADPTVITTPSTAEDHPTGEDDMGEPQVVTADAQAPAEAKAETKPEA